MSDTQKDLYKKNLGKTGENRAIKFLKKLKYKILEKNFVTPFGETDILAQDGEYIVFVEVKTRTNLNYGAPCEAVGYYKQKKYFDMAKYYIMLNNSDDIKIRFDIIEVFNDKINHIKSAFSM